MFDIFKLSDPPLKFRVRENDQNFINKLAETMIEKNAVSVDNAPTVIGLIDIDKSSYNDEKLSEYQVFIIDGNHSIQAQRIAYKRSNDPMFRYRPVNLYCGLSEDEALLLGVSRNEDTSLFVKFSDFQKVDLVRRRLYAMTNTPLDQEPPTVPKSFKQVFACLLNLKGKSDIDSKNIIRFLSTSLSNRCYLLYKEICSKNNKLPASKFECLRGLCEEDMYIFLESLSYSNLEKDDWHTFAFECQEKQKKKKKLRKDMTATIEFQKDGVTRLFVGHKAISGNMVGVRFHDDTGDEDDAFLSSSELKQYVFAKQHRYPFHIPAPNVLESTVSNAGYYTAPKVLESTVSNAGYHAAPKVLESTVSNAEKMTPCSTAKYMPFEAGSKSNKLVTSTQTEQHPYPFNAPKILKKSTVSAQEKKMHCQPKCIPWQPGYRSNKPIASTQSSTSTSGYFTIKDSMLSSDVKDFLSFMVGENIEGDEEIFIEEEDVETIPDTLIPYAELLLNTDIQEKAKEYFSPDAWMSVCSTLKMLEKLRNQKKENSQSSWNEKKEQKDKKRNIYSFASGTDISPIKGFRDRKRQYSIDIGASSLPGGTKSDKKTQLTVSTDSSFMPEEEKTDKRSQYSVSIDTSSISGEEESGKNRSTIPDGTSNAEGTDKKRFKLRLTDISTVSDIKAYTTEYLKKYNK